jgi:uncharacterized membrane protein
MTSTTTAKSTKDPVLARWEKLKAEMLRASAEREREAKEERRLKRRGKRP